MAIVAATGTAQRRSVRAPHQTTPAASGRRRSSGIGRLPSVKPRSWVSAPNHSVHRAGARANETTPIAAVAPRAIASCRHSRRNANQSTPTAGVTFVRNTNAHVAG